MPRSLSHRPCGWQHARWLAARRLLARGGGKFGHTAADGPASAVRRPRAGAAVAAALTGGVYPTVGASGGVFGLLLAYGIYFPKSRVMLLFPPIPMPARLFVVIYAVIELYLGVTGTQEGVAHFAHLGGMLGGYLTLRYWRGSTRRLRD